MQVYLDAGATKFGLLLGRFEALNLRGCRIGHGTMADHQSTMKELQKWAARRPKSRHIYIVGGNSDQEMRDRASQLAAWAVQFGIEQHVILELANEPNISGPWVSKPEELGTLAAEIWEGIEPTGIKVLSPSVSNTGEVELEYARQMLSKIPGAVGFAFHRYTTPDLTKPRSGYLSRVAEVEAVKTVAGNRKLWMTETGQSEVYFRNQPFPYCWRRDRHEISEDEIARQTVEDLRFWYETEMIEGVSYYQLNDGPDGDNPGHRYGWRDLEDTYKDEWKQVAQAMGPEIAKVDGGVGPSPVEASRRVEAAARWFHEPEKPVKNYMPLGNSLFHALGLGMPRDYYQQVIDNLAGVTNEARFNISTLGWGNEGPETQTAPPVIPFKKGGPPDYWGYSRVVEPKFLDEMEVRLDYAVSRGIRPQLTVFWGAFQEMFVKEENGPDSTFYDVAMADFLGAVCRRVKDHPAVSIELFNEINHGSHLHFLGRKGRRNFVDYWGNFIRRLLPDHLLTVSGENVDKDGKEGGYHFAYNGQEVLDYWNVHVNRDKKPAVEGFPPWVRTCWHLNELSFEFRASNPGQGFGRNDEPIFLQTVKQHQEWPYGGSTRDWQMYGMSIFIALCAGVGTTIHNQGGFFLGYNKKRPNQPDPNFPLTEPIYTVARFYQKVLETFPFAGCTPFNSGWKGSPVREQNGPFKSFSLRGQDSKEIIITVLNPKGHLLLNLGANTYTLTAYEITGETISTSDVGPGGEFRYNLPAPAWRHGCILHLKKK